jgi:hypothetical protein
VSKDRVDFADRAAQAAAKKREKIKNQKQQPANPEIQKSSPEQKSESSLVDQFATSEEIQKLNDRLDKILERLETGENEDSQPQKVNYIRRSYDLPKRLSRRLKVESAITGESMSDIVARALERELEENGKVPPQLLDLLGDEDE